MVPCAKCDSACLPSYGGWMVISMLLTDYFSITYFKKISKKKQQLMLKHALKFVLHI